MQQPVSSSSSRRAGWGVALLITLTAIGVFISSADIIELDTLPTASQELSVDETTYYEYVAPRLDKLVEEMDDVSFMVAERSRDVVGLSIRGNRIETLSSEVKSYGDEHGVPERFSAAHQQMIDGSELAILAFGEARSALARFDFSAMPILLTDFNEAAKILHAAQDELTIIVGNDDAATGTIQRIGENTPQLLRHLISPLYNKEPGGTDL